MPSPLYQWRKALRLERALNCDARRWNMALSAVVLVTKVAEMLASTGGTSMTADLMLLGIHSTKSSALVAWTFSMFSSVSWVDTWPRYIIEGDVGVELLARPDLLGQLLNHELGVARVTRREKRRLGHVEEVEARERDQVDSELAEVAVQLTAEAEGRGASHLHLRDEVVHE